MSQSTCTTTNMKLPVYDFNAFTWAESERRLYIWRDELDELTPEFVNEDEVNHQVIFGIRSHETDVIAWFMWGKEMQAPHEFEFILESTDTKLDIQLVGLRN